MSEVENLRPNADEQAAESLSDSKAGSQGGGVQDVVADDMSFDALMAQFQPDMQAVNRVIERRLRSDVVLINQLSHYIINSGGKRLRPMLAVLSAKSYGYEGELHYLLAAIIEFIHTATLLHDDVVDESDMRRGKESAHAVWGNAASVLVGDFLYSRSFEMMVSVGSISSR